MTSSYLESKILDLEARLKAENDLNANENSLGDLGNGNFGGSRPGSGRRPKLLGNVTTPTRSRKQYDLPGSNFIPQPTVDSSEIDSKIKEIMKMSGILSIGGCKYVTDIKDMEHLGDLGSGTCGHVVRMLHRPSNSVMAVKQMRWSGDVEENKRITMDLEVVLKSHDCPNIVSCYGCFITDADVWICMELMATSFDKLSKKLSGPMPEDIIGKVALGTVRALHYLKERHGVMHRDVKPSNILIDTDGNVKLCDFGISGRLVNSKAKSGNAGCAAYMAPERISPPDPGRPDYDIRADVWSLGITLVELALGFFPFRDCNSDFEVLSRVLQDDPPTLPQNNNTFSREFRHFIEICLCKNYHQRPKYNRLLEHAFLRRYETKNVDVASWFAHVQRISPNNNGPNGLAWPKPVQNEPRRKNSADGLKGVWHSILCSPLFHRRKKSTETTTPPQVICPPPPPPPPPPLTLNQHSSTSNSTPSSPTPHHHHLGNTSPLVFQRFLHQQRHRPIHRSSSISPTQRTLDAMLSELKNIRIHESNPVTTTSRLNTSPSPEPPPRINKMVSPLLLRRLALNNSPNDNNFNHSFPRYGMPPQPPPRRKSVESKSVPCSPVPHHRFFVPPSTQQSLAAGASRNVYYWQSPFDRTPTYRSFMNSDTYQLSTIE